MSKVKRMRELISKINSEGKDKHDNIHCNSLKTKTY